MEGEADPCCAVNLPQADAKEIQAIIKRVVLTDGSEAASLSARFSRLVTPYQEQPQLLDPQLIHIVPPLAALLLTFPPEQAAVAGGSSDAGSRLRCTSRLLWQISVVRGYKTVLRFMPNDVAGFEPVVALLEALSPPSCTRAGPPSPADGTWEAQYVLLMWLSMLALIPFDLALVDSSLSSAQPAVHAAYPPLVGRVMALCRRFLENAGPTREMAAVLCGRLLTRPDMAPPLHEFVEWSCAQLAAPSSPDAAFLLPGVALALATVLKVGQRDALVPTALRILPVTVVLLDSPAAASSSLLRKLAVKVVQRAGAVFLPARVAAWRYQRGRRALASESTPPTTGSTNGGTAAQQGNGSSGGSMAVNGRDNSNSSNNSSSGAQMQREAPIAPAAPAVPDMDESDESGEDAAWLAHPDQVAAVEATLEALLVALSDRDTVVRWSAAKGLGRMTSRLLRALGDDVVDSVVQSFSVPAASDSAWHGGCLALAELARRGLLLPDRLPQVVPVVLAALEYDVRRGPCSVGGHVRDAAAYVCWAFARAYSPAALGDAVGTLAPALITAACLDREVNCRRAAAAAFQESVGRLGSFPHGIEVLTAADYFTVSVRVNAYLAVAPQVAAFPGYLPPLARHLLQRKLQHWEKSLRELAARALAALVPLDPHYFSDEALPSLLPLCTGPDLEARHGAVAAVAELLPALQAAGVAVPPPTLAAVADIAPSIDRAKLTRGKGGEVMRSALCRLIETTAHTAVPLTVDQQGCVVALALDNLRHVSPDIQQAAATALATFAERYLCTDASRLTDAGTASASATAAAAAAAAAAAGGAGVGTSSAILIEHLLQELQNSAVVATRRGAALALGAMPRWALGPQRWRIFAALAAASEAEEDSAARDAETRVNAVKALAQVALTLYSPGFGDEGEGGVQGQELPQLQQCMLAPLLAALDDYASDNRGDVGSWVRDAAMVGLTNVLCVLGPDAAAALSDSFMQRALLALVRLAVERLARLREVAGAQLQRLAPLAVAAGVGPVAVAVAAAVEGRPAEDFGNLAALPALAGLLAVPAALEAVLQGMAFSIGGLDVQLAEATAVAVADALRLLRPAEVAAVGEALLAVWVRRPRWPSMSLPLLSTADVLLSRTELAQVQALPGSTFAARLLVVVTDDVASCGDVPRLHAAATALCQLAGCAPPGVRTEALAAALRMLGSRYPKVRRYAAEQLYTLLLAWDPQEGAGGEGAGAGLECDMDAAMDLLGETPWDGPAQVVRPAQAALYAALGLPAPVAKEGGGEGGRGAQEGRGGRRDDNASYSALLMHAQRGL